MESATERSERKRQREKQRRSELASAFDVLANMLLQIEPGADVKTAACSRVGGSNLLQDSSEADLSDLSGQNITRLDLISETVEAIRRLHTENVKLKAALKAQGGQAAVDEALKVSWNGLLYNSESHTCKEPNVTSYYSVKGMPSGFSARVGSTPTSNLQAHFSSMEGVPFGQANRCLKTEQAQAEIPRIDTIARQIGLPTTMTSSNAPRLTSLHHSGLTYEEMAHLALQQFTGKTAVSEQSALEIMHDEKPSPKDDTKAPKKQAR